MKKFTKSAKKQVAKYVKIFFKGSLSVEMLGVFSFRQGKLTTPEKATQQQQNFVRHVNNMIKTNTH